MDLNTLAEENAELQRRRQIETVEALLESAQLLHSSLDPEDLLRHLLRTVMGRLAVGRGLLAVADGETMRLALIRGAAGLKAGDDYHAQAAAENGIALTFPIGDGEQPIGLLGISQPPGGEIAPEEMSFLQALLGIAASAIENARSHREMRHLNLELDQKVQELRALLDLVRGLTATLEPDEVAQLLVLTIAGRWAVRRYGLVAWKHGHPLVVRTKGMDFGDALLEPATYEGWEETLCGLPEAMRVADLPESDLRTVLRGEQAEVVFHLAAGDETTGGLVVLGSRPGRLSYSDSDLEFGAGLVAQAAVAFENSWYFRETIERRKVEQELELAAQIQEKLFPASMPQVAGYDAAARNRPARHCGGDYYDILALDGQNVSRGFLICVADVSGKGLPASLLMSNIQATLRALLGKIDSLTELASEINELLYLTTPSNKYVTAILVRIDPASGTGRYVNAGHTDCLLLRRDGEPCWLKATGTPLGLFPDMPYSEEAIDLQPGDLLALFSDGVTEAQDSSENEFGEGRVVEVFRHLRDRETESIVDEVFVEIDQFAGSAPQYDDITLFVLKRRG